MGSPGLLVAGTLRTAARLAECGLTLATDPTRTVMGRRGRSARVAESTMGPQDREHRGRLGGHGGRQFTPRDDVQPYRGRSDSGDVGNGADARRRAREKSAGANDADRRLGRRARQKEGAIAARHVARMKRLRRMMMSSSSGSE